MFGMLLLQAAATIVAPPVVVPTDWSTLAPIPYVRPPEISPALSTFVAGEIAAGRCTIPKPADGRYVVRLDVATLIGADGTLRRAVPRAIQCPTVEQYGAGLVQRFARANLRTGSAGDTWYVATIVFDWRG